MLKVRSTTTYTHERGCWQKTEKVKGEDAEERYYVDQPEKTEKVKGEDAEELCRSERSVQLDI
jgi:hypothetical protein